MLYVELFTYKVCSDENIMYLIHNMLYVELFTYEVCSD